MADDHSFTEKIKMSNFNPSHSHLIYSTVFQQRLSKGLNLRVLRLFWKRRTARGGREKVRVGVRKREMEMKNLKLMMENKSIIEENEKLRKKALQLHHENRALLSQLKKH
ncbi:hypothetical protein CsSME_00024100 [Camellia sinensis var. sinensis]|uniref:Uncharacterized protein n=1 Tax=Camellia sinensis TaxID=4442 RepID=A0A7J7H196_CAMSI|nr:hypothetical protein HYC85_016605 [Camellia sinensis]